MKNDFINKFKEFILEQKYTCLVKGKTVERKKSKQMYSQGTAILMIGLLKNFAMNARNLNDFIEKNRKVNRTKYNNLRSLRVLLFKYFAKVKYVNQILSFNFDEREYHFELCFKRKRDNNFQMEENEILVYQYIF